MGSPIVAPGPDDRFKPKNLALRQNFRANVVKSLTIPVRMPDRRWFIRTHPDPAYRSAEYVLEVKNDFSTSFYWVDEALHDALQETQDLVPKLLVTATTSQGTLFIMPVKLNLEAGREDSWSDSGLLAVETAEETWTRMVPSIQQGGYQTFTAQGDFAAPKWPDMTFQAILEKAFKDRYIDTLHHPVIKKLLAPTK